MDNDKIKELRKKIDNDQYKYTRTKKKKVKPKKKKRRINIINLLFIGFLFYVLFTVAQQEQMMRCLDNEIDIKVSEKASLGQEVSGLQEDVSKIDDPEALLELVEDIARSEYKMLKPYETMYIDKNKNKNKFIKGIGYEE